MIENTAHRDVEHHSSEVAEKSSTAQKLSHESLNSATASGARDRATIAHETKKMEGDGTLPPCTVGEPRITGPQPHGGGSDQSPAGNSSEHPVQSKPHHEQHKDGHGQPHIHHEHGEHHQHHHGHHHKPHHVHGHGPEHKPGKKLHDTAPGAHAVGPDNTSVIPPRSTGDSKDPKGDGCQPIAGQTLPSFDKWQQKLDPSGSRKSQTPEREAPPISQSSSGSPHSGADGRGAGGIPPVGRPGGDVGNAPNSRHGEPRHNTADFRPGRGDSVGGGTLPYHPHGSESIHNPNLQGPHLDSTSPDKSSVLYSSTLQWIPKKSQA